MPKTKAEKFRPTEVLLARWAKALAHPARIRILKTIAQRNECICGEIVDVLPLAQATVSQHLKELKSVGLIKGEIDGPRSCYCIDPEAIEHLSSSINVLLDRLKQCCAEEKC
jgi:ArsR family transcriptional regulator